MTKLNNLKPKRVIRAFEKAGWTRRKTSSGSHQILTKEGSGVILSIPVHKGKPIKQGLLRSQITKAGMTVEEFLEYFRSSRHGANRRYVLRIVLERPVNDERPLRFPPSRIVVA